MVKQKERAEKWRGFVSARFLPQFWHDVKARLWALLLGVITAVLVLLLQIHFHIITSGVQPRILSILWPYALLASAFVLYHLARTPWLISNEHLDAISTLKTTIAERDVTTAKLEETIRTLNEKPRRSAAEQADYDTVKEALHLLKEKGVIALRHIRKHGSLTFGTYSPALPPGLSLDNTLWVYNHCVSEGILTCRSNVGHSERTFSVSPTMAKALDELLYDKSIADLS